MIARSKLPLPRGLLALALSAWAASALAKPPDAQVMPQIIQRPPDRGTLTSDQKKAETNAAKLFAHAQSAMQMGDYHGAVSTYNDILELFEQAYGPDHERLAEPLSGIVATRVTQYYQDLRGRGHPSTGILKQAVEAQTRILKIYDGLKNVDPTQHVDLGIQLGDIYLYMGDGAHGVAAYHDAYALQTKLVSQESADELFKDINMIGFFAPGNPPDHADEWSMTIAFDVGADSRVTVADIQSNAPSNLTRLMRENFERARARPRFVGGEPVASALSQRYVYRTNGEVAIYAVKPR